MVGLPCLACPGEAGSVSVTEEVSDRPRAEGLRASQGEGTLVPSARLEHYSTSIKFVNASS